MKAIPFVFLKLASLEIRSPVKLIVIKQREKQARVRIHLKRAQSEQPEFLSPIVENQ